MALSTKPYKGMRDFYPQDMRVRNWMFGVLRKTCESFGYEEYDGPVLESLDLYTAKTSEEVVNEQSYSFTDRGDRKVIMRPEMTPTVSRMVAAKRQELGYPLRLYSIPNFFRYERPQKGRLREFWQLNADIFGDASINADIEVIQVADSIMKAFGAKDGSYQIRINSRKLLNKRVEEAGVKTSISATLRVIDRYDKQSRDETLKQLGENVDKPEELLSALETGDPSEEVNKIISTLNTLSVNSTKAVNTLARGFDYYTDVVFEVFDTNPENNRSMFGGGRYDGLVGEFGVEPVPTVGFGMGDATLQNFLESNNLIPELEPANQLAILGINVDNSKLAELASRLRGEGINVSVDYTDRKLEKKIKAAEKQGLENVLFVGDDELKSGEFNLKNISSGEEARVRLDEIKSKFLD